MHATSREDDRNCTDVRKVTLYIQDRLQIWIKLDDVEWAVRYLYIENQLKMRADRNTGPVAPALQALEEPAVAGQASEHIQDSMV